MGIDIGFDLYPQLGTKESDNKLWKEFLLDVLKQFRSDPVFSEETDGFTFKVGEHPFLNQDPTAFRRFSSKLSGKVDHYIRAVQKIAKHYFSSRIHPWSEYGYEGEPNPAYTWEEVYNPSKRPIISPSFEERKKVLLFDDLCKCVLQGWENTHVGMNGLHFVSATFKEDEGYNIIQEESGSLLNQLVSIDGWAEDVTNVVTKKAYWAVRSQQNCQAINRALIVAGTFYSKKCVAAYLKVQIDGKDVLVRTDNLSVRTIGLSPHHIGSITEPPYISKVPPSPDGETFHTFVVGITEREGIPIAMDCSIAQFGIFGPNDEPFLALPLVPYLRRVAKSHRQLNVIEKIEVNEGGIFVRTKVQNIISFMRNNCNR